MLDPCFSDPWTCVSHGSPWVLLVEPVADVPRGIAVTCVKTSIDLLLSMYISFSLSAVAPPLSSTHDLFLPLLFLLAATTTCCSLLLLLSLPSRRRLILRRILHLHLWCVRRHARHSLAQPPQRGLYEARHLCGLCGAVLQCDARVRVVGLEDEVTARCC